MAGAGVADLSAIVTDDDNHHELLVRWYDRQAFYRNREIHVWTISEDGTHHPSANGKIMGVIWRSREDFEDAYKRQAKSGSYNYFEHPGCIETIDFATYETAERWLLRKDE